MKVLDAQSLRAGPSNSLPLWRLLMVVQLSSSCKLLTGTPAHPGYLGTALWRQPFGSGLAAFQSSEPSQGHRSRILFALLGHLS